MSKALSFDFVHLFVFIVISVCCVLAEAAPTRLKDHGAYWEFKWGLADRDTDPDVARTYRVFERVAGVADKRSNRTPRLKIIQATREPWAVALPDGWIILSKGAVDICYLDASKDKGDARMAFVLGHELAHLAKNDFWHREVYLALTGDPGAKALRELLKKTSDVFEAHDHQRMAVARQKETEADDLGFVYAATAGYRVNHLLADPSKGKPDFFTQWVQQSSTKVDEFHPKAKDRATFLRNRLQRVWEKLPFFDFGSRLAFFGRCERAIFLLEEFQKLFPSREVFNNLGYCYLQQAREEMAGLQTLFWLPDRLDPQSRVRQLVVGPLRGAGSRHGLQITGKVRNLLQQSSIYLEKARVLDDIYLPARLNLLSTYMFLGQVLKARIVAAEALELAPENREIQGVNALLWYLDGRAHGIAAASLGILIKAAEVPDAPAPVLFNAARALEQTKGKRAARVYWKRLEPRLNDLPNPYRLTICQELKKGACPQIHIGQKKPLWRFPVEPGTDLKRYPERRKKFAAWSAIPIQGPQKSLRGTAYHRKDGGVSILVLDDYVMVLVLRGESLGSAQALTDKLGKPMYKETLSIGEFWHYGSNWGVLVRNGHVHEVWMLMTEKL